MKLQDLLPYDQFVFESSLSEREVIDIMDSILVSKFASLDLVTGNKYRGHRNGNKFELLDWPYILKNMLRYEGEGIITSSANEKTIIKLSVSIDALTFLLYLATIICFLASIIYDAYLLVKDHTWEETTSVAIFLSLGWFLIIIGYFRLCTWETKKRFAYFFKARIVE